MAKTRSEKKAILVRIVAIALAVLLVGSILFSILPLFGLAEEEGRSHYALDMAVDLDAQAIAVTETIDYVNATGRALNAVWLNVYANALRRTETVPVARDDWNDAFPAGYAPGGVDFISVTVDGAPADWAMSGAGETFMRVACDAAPGAVVRIVLRFHLLLTKNNWALGLGDLGWRLTNFYPVAAAYDPAAEDFVLNSWTVAADPLMSDPADYDVTLALPQTYYVAATGVAEAAGPDTDGRVAWRVSAKNVRDFSLAFSRKMNVRAGETASSLPVYACASTDAAAHAMLSAALRAMNIYEGWLGGSALERLTLVEVDSAAAAAKPGLIQVPRALCGLTARQALAEEIARLCAKQWFGGEVGCNPENEPWLTDTLAEYAALLSFEEEEGYAAYLKRLNRQVLPSLQITIPGGVTVDSHASRFDDPDEYRLVVVDRGMAVLHETRDLMGREAFIACLARYVADNRGRIASIEQFAAAANAVTGKRWDEYLVAQMQTISDYVNQQITWFE